MAGTQFCDWFSDLAVVGIRPGLLTASHAVDSIHAIVGEWDGDQRSSFIAAIRARPKLRRIYVWLCLVGFEVDPSVILSFQRLSDDFLPIEEWKRIQRPLAGAKNSEKIGRALIRKFDAFRDLDPDLVDKWAAGVVLVDDKIGRGASRRRNTIL
jgi:hypothetical protein